MKQSKTTDLVESQSAQGKQNEDCSISHTPGPWWIEHYFANPKSCSPYYQIVSEKSGIASVYEDQANAKLVSAAPDLLAIAQEIADSRCDLGDSERRIRLYAAIAKAGGRL